MTPTKNADKCPTCGALRPLRDDGTLIAHDRVTAVRGWRRSWAPCPGQGTHPTPAAVVAEVQASPLLEPGDSPQTEGERDHE